MVPYFTGTYVGWDPGIVNVFLPHKFDQLGIGMLFLVTVEFVGLWDLKSFQLIILVWQEIVVAGFYYHILILHVYFLLDIIMIMLLWDIYLVSLYLFNDLEAVHIFCWLPFSALPVGL